MRRITDRYTSLHSLSASQSIAIDVLDLGGTHLDAANAADVLRAWGSRCTSWKARAEDHGGLTSPEELIAAAHASCYSMALSNTLAKAGTPPTSIDTQATATFVPGTGITAMELEVRAAVAGISEDDFLSAAEDAKENCPVSQALKGNVPISLVATLS